MRGLLGQNIVLPLLSLNENVCSYELHCPAHDAYCAFGYLIQNRGDSRVCKVAGVSDADLDVEPALPYSTVRDAVWAFALHQSPISTKALPD